MKTYHYVLSEQCNMNCTYCDVDVKNKNKISLSDFDKLFDNIKHERFVFDIFGGEAFLNLDDVEYIVKKLQIDNCIKINITSNGTIYNSRVIDIMNSPKVNITLSHDGENQKLHRGNKKVFSKEYLEHSANIHCMVVGKDFDTDNYLINLEKSFQKMHQKTVDVTLVRDIGTWTEEQARRFIISFRKYVDYMLPMILECTNYNQLPGLIKTYLSPIIEYSYTGYQKTNCQAGIKYFAISPKSKDLVPCERFLRDDAVYTKFKKNFGKEYLNECDTCDIKNTCHKGCIFEQVKNNGVIPELCAIYKGIDTELKVLLKATGTHLIKLFVENSKGI